MGKNVTISTLPNIGQNYLPKINTSNIFANSLVYDDGSSVLINTTTASAFRLDVNGSIRATSGTLTGALSGTSATFSGNVGIGNNVADAINNASGLGNLVVGNGGSSSQGITIYTNSSTYGGLNFADATTGGGAYAGYIKFDHTNDSMGFFIGNSSKLTIASTGAATFSSSVTAGGLIQANGTTASRSDTQGVSLFNNNVDYRIAFDSVGNTVGYIRYNVDTANSAAHGHIFSAGDYNVTPTNLMLIRADGNVGIGTSSPSSYTGFTTLQVNGTSGTNGGVFRSVSFDGTKSFNIYANADGANFNTTSAIPFRFLTQDTPRMTITSGGRVGITTGLNTTETTSQLYIDGSGYTAYHWMDSTAYYIGQNSTLREIRIYSGASTAGVKLTNGSTSWGTYSDERLKTNIENIDNVLDKIKDIRTVRYHLKDIDANDRQKRFGVIAQDLVGKFDEVLNLSKRSVDDETEYYDVRYTELIPILIKGIQELKAEIDILKK